jgi:hypothetical protein
MAIAFSRAGTLYCFFIATLPAPDGALWIPSNAGVNPEMFTVCKIEFNLTNRL